MMPVRRAIKRRLRRVADVLTCRSNLGFCPICERRVFFVRRGPWLRDQYLCGTCGSIPRFRALILTLEIFFPHWRRLTMHESSPGSPSSDKLARECEGYSSSQFFPGVQPGSYADGVLCQDVQALTFAAGTFDLFVTQDVFEHVPDPRRGFAEVARVLKPGGAHVFTVPYYVGKPTFVRARLAEDGSMSYSAPKQFHQNPVDAEGSLVTTEWGDDVADFIHAASGLTTTIYHYHDPSKGLLGEFLYVFVSRKTGQKE